MIGQNDLKVDQPKGTGATVAPAPQRFRLARQVLPKSYLILVLIAIIIAGYYISPDFITGRNLQNVITSAAIIAVLAIGQFFVILTGGIDLSVGSTLAMSTVVVAIALRSGMPAGAAIAFTLLAAAIAGAINGVLIVWLHLPPFIATLAMLSAVEGFSYIIQSTSLIAITNSTFVTIFSTGTVLGVPNSVVIFVVLAALAAFIAKYSTFGRQLYAIGGNPEAARLSGLPVARNLLITYTLSGLLAGLAGLISAGQLLQGSSLIGSNYELDAIAAVVVGGASLFGGKGDPISAIIGVFVLSLIVNIMNLIGISSEPQLVIKGAVIVIAVFLSSAGGVQRIGGFFSGLRRHRTAVAR
jgi:ribose transport system permease protein